MIQQSIGMLAAEIARRYGDAVGDLQFLGGFRNRAYAYEQQGQSYILRVSSESLRTVEMVSAEIDWLRYLSECGLSVARPVCSLAGNWVEVADVAGKSVPVVVFEKAPGGSPREADWNETLFRKIGSFLGKMHQLTRAYVPSDVRYRRPVWWEDMDAFAAAYLPTVDRAVQQKYWGLRSYFEGLPQPKDAYGLVHIDFHRGNFFIHQGNLTLFDFDDSQYSWFAEDLAMALFYAIWPSGGTAEKQSFAQTFYQALLEGYRQEYKLEERWLVEIPSFLKRREICLYMVLTSLGEAQWQEEAQQFMAGRRERILDNVPYVDLGFSG